MTPSSINQGNETPVVSRRRFLVGGAAALGVLGIGAPLLSACGGAASVDGDGRSATVAIQAPLVSLDPPLINNIAVAAGVRHVLESFVSLDSTGKVVPALAESWEVQSDGVTWLLHLRKDVTFHDGSPWNAAVAKKNLDRYLSRPSDFPRAQSFGFIKEVTALDELTLQVRTDTPQSGFVNWLSYYAMGFHSGPSIDTYGDDVALHGVGTGPFKVTNFVPNERLEMTRFDGYWGAKPQLEKLTIATVPDAAGRMAMVETGEANAAAGIAPSMASTIEKSKRMTLSTTPSVRMVYIGINSQHPDLKDVKVRRALNHAVDSAEILKTIIGGHGTLAESVMPQMIPGFAAQEPYAYDPDKAAALLDEAGWRIGANGKRAKDGKTLNLTIQTTDGFTAGDRATCEAVLGYLTAVGIEAKLSVIDQNGYFSKMQEESSKTTTTLNYFAYGTSIVDPTHALGVLEGSWSNINSIYARYASDDFDAEYRRILTAVDDEAARTAATQAAQKIAWDDAPWIFLFSLNSLMAIANGTTDVTDSPQELYSLVEAAR